MTRAMRFAVIPTYGRSCLAECIDAIAPQVDRVILVLHNWWPETGIHNMPTHARFIEYRREVPNISEMWNLGLKMADFLAQRAPHYVAVLNDDAVVPDDWFNRVQDAMQGGGYAAGYMGDAVRMPGYAYMLDGTKGIRANEDLKWWYSDDQIEHDAYRLGGVVCVTGEIKHLHPNSTTTGRLAEQAVLDQHTFLSLYGGPPPRHLLVTR